ncbi:nitroreductase family protein [Microbacterium sp. SORGH_AS_0888]|uniref:nitroreductase family protein n=1 Tax=Microbacterium sp. SORGH_AS_0888 TaxID=3041791 RepID=UPI002784CDA8|nr:nitroreductase family protein [Microbacterium sp. SORGH_AS_0888]MDQ1129784.1 nitroreductase [Microbacterium sp. SORGH_AS_0888]
MPDTLDRVAVTDAPILDVLSQRWSTRAYDSTAPIDEEALRAALEAARWSPSAYNNQPWRFIVARRGTETHAKIVESLIEFNQAWAAPAGALVVFIAETSREGREFPSALYDLGQAAAHFTVQAHANGLYTHQLTGFDADAVAAAFELDDTLRPFSVMAVGAHGTIDDAPEFARDGESAPRVRRPIAESVLVDD